MIKIVRKNKVFFLGLFMGIGLMIPVVFPSSYQRMDIEYFATTDDLKYLNTYQTYFNESTTIPNDDIVLIGIMNVTKTKFILIGVQFEGAIDILRIGVLKHDTETLLYDRRTPSVSTTITVEIEEPGIYSCAVFYSPGDPYSLTISAIYLT